VFYRWKARYNPKYLKSLEDDKKTRRPHHLRSMTTAPGIIRMIYDIRKGNLEKSKYEIQEELRRRGIIVGQSAIRRQSTDTRNSTMRTESARPTEDTSSPESKPPGSYETNIQAP
jgi:hypothetical protein